MPLVLLTTLVTALLGQFGRAILTGRTVSPLLYDRALCGSTPLGILTPGYPGAALEKIQGLVEILAKLHLITIPILKPYGYNYHRWLSLNIM